MVYTITYVIHKYTFSEEIKYSAVFKYKSFRLETWRKQERRTSQRFPFFSPDKAYSAMRSEYIIHIKMDSLLQVQRCY